MVRANRDRHVNVLLDPQSYLTMKPKSDTEIDIDIKIQRMLVAINVITLKIKNELEIINELVKEDGHLHTVVDKANLTLSKQAEEMGIDVVEVINESKRKSRSEPNLLSSITSTVITEKLLEQR